MTVSEIQDFLARKYKNTDIKFIGAGSDSYAFKVGKLVCRFSMRDKDIFIKESQVCDFIRPYISVNIPKIEIHSIPGMFYVSHEMITGNKWSWHKFSYQPRRQNNLARGCAEFLAQLHGINTAALLRAIPELRSGIPYIDFSVVRDSLSRFMSPGQLSFFEKNYRRIITAPVKESDMVLVHLGLKGANSVTDDDGNLSGVFDFCNCGIYERGRDLVLMSLSRNRPLYRAFIKEYEKRSGVRVDKKRVNDLRAVEFLWQKRWFYNGQFCPLNDRFLKKNIAGALARFHKLPRFAAGVIYARLMLNGWIRKQTSRARLKK